jgi:hypothetical protein
MTFSASPSFRDWKATPTHWPAELNAGPPELPGLIAASICTASKSHEPCTYCCAQPALVSLWPYALTQSPGPATLPRGQSRSGAADSPRPSSRSARLAFP